MLSGNLHGDLDVSPMNQFYEDEAIVDEVIRQGEWRVRYGGTFWSARTTEPNVMFAPNDVVKVVGRQRITLLIQPKG